MKCSMSIKPISKVLIRIYGGSHKDAEQTAKERLEEKNRFALIASQGLGPDFYFDFGDGRLEEFVDGRIAKMEEMADLKFCQEIARQIARFHLIKGVTRQSTSSFQKHVKGFLWVIRRRSCGDLKSLDIDSEGSFSCF
ncbi:hypothetical protein MHBO_000813 [Bonamia ostreae]|uniref:ethanolamine kinase n=1 Tax=Bonamia ostreae TaxID=126728 RepID=A0ABV2AHS0_9EUKA